MNIYAFIPFISGLLNLVTGLFVFFKSRKSYLCRPYFFCAVTLAGYCFLQSGLVLFSYQERVLALWTKVFFSLSALTVPAFINLLLKLEKKNKFLLRAVFAASLAVAFVSLLVLNLQQVLRFVVFPWGRTLPLNNLPNFLFLINCLFFLPLSAVLLWIQSGHPQKARLLERQIVFVILGVLAIVIGMFLNFGPSFGIGIYPVGSPLMTIAFIAMAYTIAQYRFLEFDIILNRTVLAFLFVAPLLILHIIISALFLKTLGFVVSTTFSLLLIIMLVMVTPYKGLMQGIVESAVYRGRYNYQKVLRDLSRSLPNILDLDQLLEYIMHVLLQTFDLEKGVVFLENDGDPRFRIRAGYGVKDLLGSGFEISPFEDIIRRLMLTKKIQIREELKQFENENEVERKFSFLPGFEVELVAPLFFGQRLTGFVCLSRKKQGHIYNQGDVDVLNTFMRDAAAAIEHVRLYREAIIDPVTRVYNGHYFRMRLREEIARAQRYVHPLALLLIEIDNYDNLTAMFGEEETGQILKVMAQYLKKKLRNVDFVARCDKRTFGVILPQGAGREKLKKMVKGALLVAERLQADLEELKNSGTHNSRAIKASIGAVSCEFPDKSLGEDQVLKRAQEALTKAKQGGQGKKIAFYEDRYA